jgi:nucleoside-diphosphate-sugar epimerase
MSAAARRYIVTGANGFIGARLATRFRERGEVLAVDQFWGHAPKVAEPRIALDLAQPLPDAPELAGATVLHAAGLVNVEDRRLAWDGNVNATFNVLDWAVRHEVPHVVLFSTADVYPFKPGHRHRESEPVAPNGIFGHSKQLCERIGAAFTRLYQLPVTVVRLFAPYGPGQIRGVIADLDRAVREQTEIAAGRDGTPHMTPVHVDDVVDAIERLDASADGYRVFNLCGDTVVSTLEVIRILETVHGRSARIVFRDDARGDLLGDNAAIGEAIGWRPRHGIETLGRAPAEAHTR